MNTLFRLSRSHCLIFSLKSLYTLFISQEPGKEWSHAAMHLRRCFPMLPGKHRRGELSHIPPQPPGVLEDHAETAISDRPHMRLLVMARRAEGEKCRRRIFPRGYATPIVPMMDMQRDIRGLTELTPPVIAAQYF